MRSAILCVTVMVVCYFWLMTTVQEMTLNSRASGVGDGLEVGKGHEAHVGEGGAREEGEPTQQVVAVRAVVQRRAV